MEFDFISTFWSVDAVRGDPLRPCAKSQLPHKSVNLFLILAIVKDKLTDLWGG